jgi:hypothetical protein
MSPPNPDLLSQVSSWAIRQIDKGYKGFELLIRSNTGYVLVDRYPGEKNTIESILADIQANAAGAETTTQFRLTAVSDGQGQHNPTRAITLAPSEPLHESERYEDRNIVRLCLEHIDKQNRVITQVVPACLAAMGGMVQGLSTHFGTIADTHEAALRILRESRVETLEAERMMMLEASKQARVDKIVDLGLATIPQLLAKFGEKKS